MKSTTLNKAVAILGAVIGLAFTTQATAEQELSLNLASPAAAIEVAGLQPTTEQQQQLTEELWAKALPSCSYCTATSQMQTTESGIVEVTTVIGSIPDVSYGRLASMRLRQFSTFNAPETHL